MGIQSFQAIETCGQQNIFQLKEYIEEKRRETDFQSQKEQCGMFIDELNNIHISQAANQPSLSGPIF